MGEDAKSEKVSERSDMKHANSSQKLRCNGVLDTVGGVVTLEL